MIAKKCPYVYLCLLLGNYSWHIDRTWEDTGLGEQAVRLRMGYGPEPADTTLSRAYKTPGSFRDGGLPTSPWPSQNSILVLFRPFPSHDSCTRDNSPCALFTPSFLLPCKCTLCSFIRSIWRRLAAQLPAIQILSLNGHKEGTHGRVSFHWIFAHSTLCTQTALLFLVCTTNSCLFSQTQLRYLLSTELLPCL